LEVFGVCKGVDKNIKECGGKDAALTDTSEDRERVGGPKGGLCPGGLFFVDVSDKMQNFPINIEVVEVVPETIVPYGIVCLTEINKEEVSRAVKLSTAGTVFIKGCDLLRTFAFATETTLELGDEVIIF
jgi:hypothetical protein